MIIAVLTAERDAALAEVETWKRRYHEAADRGLGWQDRAERAEQALRPFAGLYDAEPPTEWNWEVMQRNILAARAALQDSGLATPAVPVAGDLDGSEAKLICQWTNFWDQIDDGAPRETCDQPATHTACTPKVGVVCEKHKCRCSKPLT